MATVTVRSLKNLQQVVVTDSYAFIVDEPEDDGDDLGPSAYDCSGRPGHLNGDDDPPVFCGGKGGRYGR